MRTNRTTLITQDNSAPCTDITRLAHPNSRAVTTEKIRDPKSESVPENQWSSEASIPQDYKLINALIMRAAIRGMQKALVVLHKYYHDGGRELGFSLELKEHFNILRSKPEITPEDNMALSYVRYGLQDRKVLLREVDNRAYFPAELAKRLKGQIRQACYPGSKPTAGHVTTSMPLLGVDLTKLSTRPD